MTPVVTNNRDFDPDKTFTAVAKTSQNLRSAGGASGFSGKIGPRTRGLAKANPGKLNFGSAGIGNATHLAAELFKQRTGIDIVHVPYKGAAEAITGVMSGQVQMFFGDIGGVLPLIREGRVRALAISSEARSTRPADAADHDRKRRARLCGADLHRRGGARRDPAGDRRQAQCGAERQPADPGGSGRLRRIGAESQPSSPQEFAAFLAAEREKWREVVRLSGIKIE